MQLLLADVRIGQHLQTHVVEALQRPHTGGTHCNSLASVRYQTLYGVPANSNVLRVHGVLANGLALDGTEGACSDVQRQFFALNAVGIDIPQHALREVQSCRRSCHTAFDLRVHRLVGRLVALLCIAIQVRRNRQFAHGVQDVGKRHTGRPLQCYELAGTHLAFAHSADLDLFAFDFNHPGERHLHLPLLLVAHQTEPLTGLCLLEHLLVVGWPIGFQQKHLYQCTCGLSLSVRLAEVQACLNHLGIVHHHQGTLGQVFRQVVEDIFSYDAFIVHQQLRVVALRHRKLRNPLVCQFIVVIAYVYFFRFNVHNACKGTNKKQLNQISCLRICY